MLVRIVFFVSLTLLPLLANTSIIQISRTSSGDEVVCSTNANDCFNRRPGSVSSISDNGELVLFSGPMGLMDGSPSMGAAYLYNIALGQLQWIDAGGTEGPNGVYLSLAGNGRYLSLSTSASGAGGDNDNFWDVFKFDINNSNLSYISNSPGESGADSGYVFRSLNGVVPIFESGLTNSALSSDGSILAFPSRLKNLSGDELGWNPSRIFTYNSNNNSYKLISHEARAHAVKPVISPNGRYVAFESQYNNNIGNSGGISQVSMFPFVHDAQSDTITQLGAGNNWSALNSLSFGSFSITNNEVIYHANNPSTGYFSIYRRKLPAMQYSDELLVSENGAHVYNPSISDDGRYLVFYSNASFPELPSSGGNIQLYIKDIVSGNVALVSQDSNGNAGNDDTGEPVFNNGSFIVPTSPQISADSCRIVFDSKASNLTANDTDFEVDIFVAENPLNNCDPFSSEPLPEPQQSECPYENIFVCILPAITLLLF